MICNSKMYSEEIVWEFYASYAATIRGSIHKKANPKGQDPLSYTIVRGVRVSISYTTISQFFMAPTPIIVGRPSQLTLIIAGRLCSLKLS